MNPDPNCIFMTPTHREALSVLLYAASRRKGFVVFTGNAGTGKTTLLRALMQATTDTKFSTVFSPRLTTDDFLELALMDFDVPDIPETKSRRIARFQDFLMELRIQGKGAVLIVDEAHLLSPENLEEIRLLTNFETSREKLLQVILAGQTELANLLNRPDLSQLKQRTEIRVNLKPLTTEEVAGYIQYRWQRAGGEQEAPFSRDAIIGIAQASMGIPRLVNSICDNALLLAFAAGDREISRAHVSSVARDLDLQQAPLLRKSEGRRLSLRDLERSPSGWAVEPEDVETTGGGVPSVGGGKHE